MFYVEEIWIKSAAARPALQECEDIMSRIYGENPRYWPYGLDTKGHDELYMIREASTKKAVGFTGWQEFREGRDRVGFYSIGVLPEYRGNGFAKAAVSQLLERKAAGVDRVQAFIVPGNTKSIRLAAVLGIPVVH